MQITYRVHKVEQKAGGVTAKWEGCQARDHCSRLRFSIHKSGTTTSGYFPAMLVAKNIYLINHLDINFSHVSDKTFPSRVCWSFPSLNRNPINWKNKLNKREICNTEDCKISTYLWHLFWQLVFLCLWGHKQWDGLSLISSHSWTGVPVKCPALQDVKQDELKGFQVDFWRNK